MPSFKKTKTAEKKIDALLKEVGHDVHALKRLAHLLETRFNAEGGSGEQAASCAATPPSNTSRRPSG